MSNQPDMNDARFIAESVTVAKDTGLTPRQLADQRAELLESLGALGVIGNGYCFCSHDRDPDKADHEPECRDARAAIAKATGETP